MPQPPRSNPALPWRQLRSHVRTIKQKGIDEFAAVFAQTALDTSPQMCGDEVEYMLFAHGMHIAPLATHALRLLPDGPGIWSPEFASYMVESSPEAPYDLHCLASVRTSMRERRARLAACLPPGAFALTLSAYPLLGTRHIGAQNPASQSSLVPDSLISTHPRFKALVRNIRQRRGSKVDIRIPAFRDSRTTDTDVCMDSMAFGMGCCCLQATVSAGSLRLCRDLYDQLAIVSPLLLALTAATPVLRGRLTAHDTRWHVLQQCVDDRTPRESRTIPKPRFSSADLYVADAVDDRLNDLDVPLCTDALDTLTARGVDTRLARHVASLFVRDPLVVHAPVAALLDAPGTACFENIQTTNWRSVRLKAPGAVPCWAVELRTMEAQPTDFENCAFFCFAVLLARSFIAGTRFYIPMSLNDANFDRAVRIDAVRTQHFFFNCGTVRELSLCEIVNGSAGFCGLAEIARTEARRDQNSAELMHYIDFVAARATGTYPTVASWTRAFVTAHPAYAHDSVVTDSIAADLVAELRRITDTDSPDYLLPQAPPRAGPH